MLDETLSRLARANPSTKFLRARAGALGFATSTSKSNSSSLLRAPFPLHRTPSRKILVPGRFAEEDEDEEDGEYGSDDDRSDGGWEDDEVDTDVLPTMLVYRGGQLVHSWIRVDWEAKAGVEELLRK